MPQKINLDLNNSIFNVYQTEQSNKLKNSPIQNNEAQVEKTWEAQLNPRPTHPNAIGSRIDICI